MTRVVHLCMFTMFCNMVNTFLSIMCGHLNLVLSVTVLRSFSVTAILVVLLMYCVTPGMIVILLVLSIFLVLLLPEEMTLNQGKTHQGDSQYRVISSGRRRTRNIERTRRMTIIPGPSNLE